MTENRVDIGARPPETELPPPPPEALTGLERARGAPEAARPAAVASVVADHPALLLGWAELGEMAESAGRPREASGTGAPAGGAGSPSVSRLVEAYAYFRVGYHRGLDALRGAGWRGSGYVRGRHAPNRGFLRCLDGLRRTAGAIGEHAESERCATFLRQLDPDWPLGPASGPSVGPSVGPSPGPSAGPSAGTGA